MPIFNLRALLVVLSLGGLVALAERYIVLMGVAHAMQSVLVGVISGCAVFLGAHRGARLLRLVMGRSIVRHEREGLARQVLASRGLSLCVVRSDAIWAVTASDGNGACVFISTALLAREQTDLLKGVLAHESAHAELGHVRRLSDILGFLALAKFSFGVPLPAVIAVLLAYLAMMRSWEFEADAHAARTIGSRQMEEALESIARQVSAGRMSRVAEWFSAHPCLYRRIERMRGR